MPQVLPTIPVNMEIVDAKGRINTFFRLLWQNLVSGSVQTPTIATFTTGAVDKTAAVVTSALYTALANGKYRVSFYLRKTIADGVNSSATVTIGWVDRGAALTFAFAALALDTATAYQSDELPMINVDLATDITIAIAYSSNTPAKMAYYCVAAVEFLP